MNKRILLGIAVMLAGCQTAPMTAGGSFDPKSAGREWADAYNACDVDALTRLYHPRAHLWLAPSRTPATTPGAIHDTFRADCSPGSPRRSIAITPISVQDFGDTAVGVGTAQVSVTRPDGQIAQIPVRYAATYRKEGGRWLIIQQHSSLFPPGPAQ